jgi:DNA primase
MSKDNYDFVKQHNPEAFRKAVAIGSFAQAYVWQRLSSCEDWDDSDDNEFGAQVEKVVMELVAEVIGAYKPSDDAAFLSSSEE